MNRPSRLVRWALGYTACDRCQDCAALHVEVLEGIPLSPRYTRQHFCWACFQGHFILDADAMALACDAARILKTVADQAHNLFTGVETR